MPTPVTIGSADQLEWKKITGTYSTVIACPLTCRSRQAPEGISPWAHQANGGVDLVLVRGCSKLNLLKWFIHQRRVTQVRIWGAMGERGEKEEERERERERERKYHTHTLSLSLYPPLQLNLPYVQVHRVKEFKFREILTPPQRAEEEINLVSDVSKHCTCIY